MAAYTHNADYVLVSQGILDSSSYFMVYNGGYDGAISYARSQMKGIIQLPGEKSAENPKPRLSLATLKSNIPYEEGKEVAKDQLEIHIDATSLERIIQSQQPAKSRIEQIRLEEIKEPILFGNFPLSLRK